MEGKGQKSRLHRERVVLTVFPKIISRAEILFMLNVCIYGEMGPRRGRMCWTVKDLQSVTIVAAWPWLSSELLLRDIEPEALWPNILCHFPLVLLKKTLIFALKTPEMRVEQWLCGIHWCVGLH